MYKNILLTYDGSDIDQKSLIECQDLANWRSAQVTLLTVMPHYNALVGMEGVFVDNGSVPRGDPVQLAILNSGVRSLLAGGYDAKGVCLTGDPAEEIAIYAQRSNSDLIIVGHKHKSHWAARWWGTFKSKALIEIAPCSVLIVILKNS